VEFRAEPLAKRKTAGFRDSSAPPDGVGVNAPELPESDTRLRLGCRIRLSGDSGAFHAPGGRRVAATHDKSVDSSCAKWDRNGTRPESEKKTPSLLFPARRGRLIKPIGLGLELVEPVLGFPSPLHSLGAAYPSNGNPARPFPRVLHTGEGCSWSCRIGQKLDMREVRRRVHLVSHRRIF